MFAHPPQEHTLAKDSLSKALPLYSSATTPAHSPQGIKRKVDDMEKFNLPEDATQISTRVKLEPGSPSHVSSRRSHVRDVQSEMPIYYVDYSGSEDREEDMLDIDDDQSDTTMRPSTTTLPPEGQQAVSSVDACVPSEHSLEIYAARVAPHDDERGTTGMLPVPPELDKSPPQHWQKTRKKPRHRRIPTGGRYKDVPYDSIPDYAPPISTLPTDNNDILQIEWHQKSNIDLSNDPDRQLLHEAELKLATTLDLSCAKYLYTKRLIFQARFEALKEGRRFGYSDSRNAAKIAAHKAGKLYGAWSKAGWFDKKYFLKHLGEIQSPLSSSNKGSERNDDRATHSSGLTDLDEWDISDSGFDLTSEGDEDSTDEDPANSIGSFDDAENGIGRKRVNLHPEKFMRQKPDGSSVEESDSRKRRSLDDNIFETRRSVSRTKTTNEVSANEDGRLRPRHLSRGSLYTANCDGLSRDNTQALPVHEARSMTQEIRTPPSSGFRDDSTGFSTSKAKTKYRESGGQRPDARPAPMPIPRSLDEADTADIMLVKMKEEGRPLYEIEETWAKMTGRAHAANSLLCRYRRIKANMAFTRFKVKKKTGKPPAFTRPQLRPKDDHLLLAAEAEVEENFQREKADLLEEIESHFLAEKWNLVAKAMSRSGAASYSAKLIQAKYESLTKRSKKVHSKDENKSENSSLLRATAAKAESHPEALTPSKPRLGEIANVTTSPANGTERKAKKPVKSKSQVHQDHSERMRRVWAKRRALGRDGHRGGRPKAATIAKNAKTPKINNAIVLTANPWLAPSPTPTYPSNHAPYSSTPKRSQPTTLQQKMSQDSDQHKKSLAYIVPAAPPKSSHP